MRDKSSFYIGGKLAEGSFGNVFLAGNLKGLPSSGQYVYKEYKDYAKPNDTKLPSFVDFYYNLTPSAKEYLDSICSWPHEIVKENGGISGFLMPQVPAKFYCDIKFSSGSKKVEAKFEHLLMPDSLLKRRQIPITNKKRYQLLYTLVKELDFFHEHKICIGDFSHSNILFSLGDCSVFFIDCDSFRVEGNTIFPQTETGNWGVAEQYPDEELGTEASDIYKLGLIALRLLMNSNNPTLYQATKNTDYLSSNIATGVKEVIENSLKDEESRPSLAKWRSVLSEAIRNGVEEVEVVDDCVPLAQQVTQQAIQQTTQRATQQTYYQSTQYKSQPTVRQKKGDRIFIIMCLAALVVVGCFAYLGERKANQAEAASAVGQEEMITDTYTWEWSEEPWEVVENINYGVMILSDTISDCEGFTLGLKLKDGNLGEWDVYVYLGDGDYITQKDKVGSMNLTQRGEYTYMEYSFSKRDVCWILVGPSEGGGSREYSADLSDVISDGHVYQVSFSENSGQKQFLKPALIPNTPEQDIAVMPSDAMRNDFVLADSDSRPLTKSDLDRLSEAQIRIARNELFARRGRIFESADMKEYFQSQAWYRGTVPPATFDSNRGEYMNSTEIANVDFIHNYEEEQKRSGSRQNTTAAHSNATRNEFVFADSDSRLLTNSDLDRLSGAQIRIARNELFARRGRIFEKADMKEYFESQAWYNGTVPATTFDSSRGKYMNSIEIANMDFIVKYEQDHGINQ